MKLGLSLLCILEIFKEIEEKEEEIEVIGEIEEMIEGKEEAAEGEEEEAEEVDMNETIMKMIDKGIEMTETEGDKTVENQFMLINKLGKNPITKKNSTRESYKKAIV